MNNIKLPVLLIALMIFASARIATAQTATFTYQGRLTDASTQANGNYDLGFALFDQATGGTQIGAAQTRAGVTVSNGVFTVQLDFGAAAFPGADRYLQIAVKRPLDANFTTLAPRQQVTSTPYSIRAISAQSADTATNAAQLGGTAANQFVQTGDSRLSDSRTPTAGSNFYVQNQNSGTQTSANFNIGGTGTANIFNATTQYNIGGNRVLSNAGSFNLFAGVNAGAANTTGDGNSFFGMNAGNANTTSSGNSFFGANAGFSNTTGEQNSFFGLNAGLSNTTGIYNSFFGASAGGANTTGGTNSFVGYFAGQANTTGSNNSFVGYFAGRRNATGNDNSFFGVNAGRNVSGNSNSFVGVSAGFLNTTGFGNSFFGVSAGSANMTGANNTIIGSNANVGPTDLTFATAIGSGAIVRQSNTIVLGRENGQDLVRIYRLGSAGSTQVCLNTVNELASCSSSLRYKTNIAPFSSGLNLVKQLQPISFDWKDGGMKDVGFGAEDVAVISPLLVNYNKAGEVEGVKYDRLSVLFVNAFREQQTQIETQNTQIERQQKQIDDLKKIVCAIKPDALVCKSENK